MRKNNKGFSLPELIIAFAILTIVVGACFTFFVQTLNFFHSGSTESRLQNESQLTMSQLETIALNGSQGVGLDPSSPAGTTVGSTLYIYNHDVVEVTSGGVTTYAPEYTATVIYQDGNYLKYYKRQVNITVTDPVNEVYDYQFAKTEAEDKADEQILSEYIKDFQVDVSALDTSQQLKVNIKFSSKNKVYKADKTIMIRNQTAKGSLEDYFKDVAKEDRQYDISKITISPSTPLYLWEGTSSISGDISTTLYSSSNAVIGGTVIYTLDGNSKAQINRSTGIVTLDDPMDVSSLTVRATTLASINSSGGNQAKYMQANTTILVKRITAVTLQEDTQNTNDLEHKELTFKLTGDNFQRDADLAAIQPVAVSGGNIVTGITAVSAESNSQTLTYKVSLKRPTNYKGKTYNVTMQVTVHGHEYTKTLSVVFDGTDANKAIKDAVIVNAGDPATAEGYHSTQITALRGDSSSLQMKVIYDDDSYAILSQEDWKITPEDSSIAVTSNSGGYTLSYNVRKYGSRVEIPVRTSYDEVEVAADNSTSVVQKDGPTLTLVFEPVSLKLANVNETTQTKFPVTRGENCQLNFEILGIKDGTIYMADASSSTMSATASGLTASVVVPTSAISASRLSFGVKNAKNQKLLDDNGNEFTCDITLQPANPNTYNSNGTSQGVYIPYVSQISSFDSTKSEPQENQEVVIYDTAGKKLTYTYVKVSGNWRYKVTREADGSTYLYDSMARKWQKQ